MKINLSTGIVWHSNIARNTQAGGLSLLSQPATADTFIKTGKNVSFGEDSWFTRRIWMKNFDPLNASNSTLDEYAEIFHMYDIDEIVKEKYPVGFFTTGRQAKQNIAKSRLKPRVQKILKEKENLLNRRIELLKKETLGESNIVRQKNRLGQNFLIPFKLVNESKESSYPLANGILIYGSAETKDKNEFVNWIKSQALDAEAGYSEISYTESPEQFIDKIGDALKTNKTYYDKFHKNSIIYLKDADKLLTDTHNEESLDCINELKQFIENSNENYHTTFVVSTDMPLDCFDRAVISKHRFSQTVFLKDGITAEEKQELEKINARLEHLKNMSGKSNNYFYEEEYCISDYESPFDRL